MGWFDDFADDTDMGNWWDDFPSDTDMGAGILDDFASGADDVSYLDSETGEIVSGADAEALSADVPNVPGGPTGTSLSDQLRSREGSPTTWTPGSEPFDLNAMADPSASIASAGGMDWLKALGQGLKAGLGALSGGSGQGGLAGLTQSGGGGAAISGLPGLMSAGIPQVGGVGAPDITRVGAWSQPDLTRADIASAGGMSQPDIASAGGMSQPDIARLGGMSQADILGGARMQDAIHAAYAQGQADPGMRLGLQGAIDAGALRDEFSPLVMPFAPIGGAVPPAQRLSGLQRLAAERFG